MRLVPGKPCLYEFIAHTSGGAARVPRTLWKNKKIFRSKHVYVCELDLYIDLGRNNFIKSATWCNFHPVVVNCFVVFVRLILLLLISYLERDTSDSLECLLCAYLWSLNWSWHIVVSVVSSISVISMVAFNTHLIVINCSTSPILRRFCYPFCFYLFYAFIHILFAFHLQLSTFRTSHMKLTETSRPVFLNINRFFSSNDI